MFVAARFCYGQPNTHGWRKILVRTDTPTHGPSTSISVHGSPAALGSPASRESTQTSMITRPPYSTLASAAAASRHRTPRTSGEPPRMFKFGLKLLSRHAPEPSRPPRRRRGGALGAAGVGPRRRVPARGGAAVGPARAPARGEEGPRPASHRGARGRSRPPGSGVRRRRPEPAAARMPLRREH